MVIETHLVFWFKTVEVFYQKNSAGLSLKHFANEIE